MCSIEEKDDPEAKWNNWDGGRGFVLERHFLPSAYNTDIGGGMLHAIKPIRMLLPPRLQHTFDFVFITQILSRSSNLLSYRCMYFDFSLEGRVFDKMKLYHRAR